MIRSTRSVCRLRGMFVGQPTRRRLPCSAVAALLSVTLLGGGAGSLRAADCNRNGSEDDVDLADGVSEDCNSNGLPDECEVAALSYGVQQGVAETERYPRGMVLADFNGDRSIDIVTANQDGDTSSTISVLLNDGEASFVARSYGDAVRALDIDAADLDLDGDLDVVTANFLTVEVLWNDGSGGFETRTTLDVERQTRSVHLADVDEDGLADILATNTRNDDVALFLNNGEGGFGAAQSLAVGEYPIGVQAIDIDGDGPLDLITANRDSNTVSILLGDGAGGFSASAPVILDGDMPESIAAGDFDNNGLGDFAISNADQIEIYYSDGGRFTRRDIFDEEARKLHVSDVDRDGDQDLVYGARDGSTVSFLVNAGEFFTRPQTFIVSSSPELIGVGDFDGDEDADVVISFESRTRLSFLFNGEQAAVDMQDRLINMGPAPHGTTSGDFTGDGYPDIATCDGLGSSITLLTNDGSGVLRVTRTTPTGRYVNAADSADFDGDGDLDVLMAAIQDQRMQISMNNGSGTFARPTELATGQRPFHVRAGDLNGDGRPDIISANENAGTLTIWFNNPEQPGRFVGRMDPRVGSRPLGAHVGDIDGDGATDIVAANAGSRNVSVLINQGDGTFAAAVNYAIGVAPWFAWLDDMNGDGNLDLLTANSTAGTIGYLEGIGDGTFAAVITYAAGGGPYSLLTTDVNGDGARDVVTGNNSSGNMGVILGAGDGTFFQPVTFRTGAGPRYVMAEDWDQDGDMDLAAINHDSRGVSVFYNQAPETLNDDFLSNLCTEIEFENLQVPTGDGRSVKFVSPADPANAGLLPTVYINSKRFLLHEEFLAAVFPERFPALSAEEYAALVAVRATRQYYGGSIVHIDTPIGRVYGFKLIVNSGDDARELLTLEEVRGVYEHLESTFRLRPFAYVPESIAARERAAEWLNAGDPGFPIALDVTINDGGYEAYTEATGYGTVRIMDRDTFDAANESGGFGFQDIIVLDHAPRDIEGIVGGVITSEVQGALSHVAVRTARRGTPNAFVDGALSAFTPFEGQLVRLEVENREYRVEPATLPEALAFWENNRPQITGVPSVDADWSLLTSLEEMDLSPAAVTPESRYGGKATNLARLQRVLTGEFERYGEVGFAVPMKYYLEWMEANRLPSLLDSEQLLTYTEFLAELEEHPEFQQSTEFRFVALARLRNHMDDDSIVDADLVQRIANRIGEVFGATDTRVRFRSSSNVEDILEFNGAGLYDSTSACAADDLDANATGPSICDPSESRERGIARALRKVWQSVWNYRAYEERAFYGIPQDVVAMGVLVSRSFPDELANGVAFTGDPNNALDNRYIVTSQTGDISVVSPPPGILPAKDLLLVVDGAVQSITRAGGSTLIPGDGHVLDEEQLRELGRVLAHVDANLDVDLGDHDRQQVVLDFEFKIESDGTLGVKQVRPFLRTRPLPPSPQFELEVPPGAVACTQFGIQSFGRDPQVIRSFKSRIIFREGTHVLDSRQLASTSNLIEELSFGPDGEPALPMGPGVLLASRVENRAITNHLFILEQFFQTASGLELRVVLRLTTYFSARGEIPIGTGHLSIDETYLEEQEDLIAQIIDPSMPDLLRTIEYFSCDFASLDLFEVGAEFEDGTAVSIIERFDPPAVSDEYGHVAVLSARIQIGEEARRTTVFEDLVYYGLRHNQFVRHLVALDPPMDAPGFDTPIGSYVVWSFDESPTGETQEPRIVYYDTMGRMIRESAAVDYRLEPTDELPPVTFERGDVDEDGRLTITDAIAVLSFLFQGTAAPNCQKAADTDDDGVLTLTDAVVSLSFLFTAGDAPAQPFGLCGTDPTEDALSCDSAAACD